MTGREDPGAEALPEAVQWHEGMLLAPQHLQLAAWRAEALLTHQLRAAIPFFWGVRRLEIDASALAAGLFRVAALDAILPDGLVAAHPLPGAPDLALDLTALEADLSAAPVAVHLAVALHGPRAAAPGALRRYRSVNGEPAPDENLGDNPIATPRLRPALGLVATTGPLVGPVGRYAALPLAMVAIRGGAHALERYQPPLLRVRRDAAVHAVAREVAEDVRAKVAALAERLKGAAAGATVEARDSEAALRALVAPLPRLEALLRDEAASPYQLYLGLCDALGAAAAVDRRLAPPAPPPYVHDDMLPAFDALRRLVLDGLKRLAAAYALIPFAALGDGAFALGAEQSPGAASFHVLLRGAGGAAVPALAAWAAQAVIATEDRIDGARRARVSGAARRRVDGIAALDMVAPEGCVLLEVSRDARHMTPGAALALRHPEGGGQPGEPIGVALVTQVAAREGAP